MKALNPITVLKQKASRRVALQNEVNVYQAKLAKLARA